MNGWIRSWGVKLVTLLVGYSMALSTARSLHRAFNYYIGLVGKVPNVPIYLALPLFAVCAAIFLFSVWKSMTRPGGFRPPRRNSGIVHKRHVNNRVSVICAPLHAVKGFQADPVKTAAPALLSARASTSERARPTTSYPRSQAFTHHGGSIKPVPSVIKTRIFRSFTRWL